MTDPVTTALSQFLTSIGYASLIPVLLALIGLASALSTVYPPTWPGAKVLHWAAILKGNAAPAVPAGTVAQVEVSKAGAEKTAEIASKV